MLERVMNNENFIAGNYDTHFIEKNQEQLHSKPNTDAPEDIVIIAAFIDYLDKITAVTTNQKEFVPAQSRWKKIPYVNHF